MDKESVLKVLAAAWSAPYEPARSSGCGRAYVCVSGDRATVHAVSAAAKKLGILFLRKAYGTGKNAIYCGYDNADGRALGKAHAVANALKAAGLSAYDNAVAD